MEPVNSSKMTSPLGTIYIYADDTAVYEIGFLEGEADFLERPSALTELCKLQLAEYFSGDRLVFTFAMIYKGTSFQKLVWEHLCRIPAGQPVSYSKLSSAMNNPLAIRAIASANGRNKIAIAVPCHRVIGSTGDMVGYAWGTWRKKWLLEHESRITQTGQGVLF